jgi:hypothetical protein
VNLPLIFVQWGLAESGKNIAFSVEFDVLFSAVFGVALGVALGARSISVMFILAISLMFTLARGVTPDIAVSVIRIVDGIAFIVTSSLLASPLVLGVLFVVGGGYLYFFSSSEREKEKGRRTLRNGIITLIISLVAYTSIGLIIGGLREGVNPSINFGSIPDVMLGLVHILAGIATALGVLFVVGGGYLYFFSSSEREKEKGRRTLGNGIIALTISLLAYTSIGLIPELIRGDLREGANPSIDSGSILDVMLGLVRALAGIVMALSVLFMMWGGLKYITSNGREEAAGAGKKILVTSTLGLIISVLTYTIVEFVGGDWSKNVVSKVVLSAVFGAGLTLNLWRPVVLYPLLVVWDTLLYQLDKRRTSRRTSLLRWHCAFWDEFQRLPLRGLDKHLFLVMERNPVEGNAAIEYLNTSHQRWAAQEVQIELDAHKLEGCEDVEAIRQVHNSLTIGELQGPVNYLLRSFSRISKDVDAALNQESAYNQREGLRPVADRLDSLLQELTRSSGKYTVRFRPIAASWKQILTNYLLELDAEVERRQEIDNPYIIAIPLTKQNEVFVKPTDISGTDISKRIEQLLLDRRRPPLLLYGQRRIGKTSLLNNLGRLLPTTIVPMFVDLQGPVSSAKDYAGFLYNIARGMIDSANKKRGLTLPPLTRDSLESDPSTCFDEWLDKVEQELKQDTILLALDEFEALDSALVKGRFDEEDILGMLRHLIQHRPRFKVLLSGSHTLEEFQRWASYLINVQVVHISYLKETEARKLIVKPVADFALRYEPEAVQRVLDLTRCHPCLVQLLCCEIVALKNEQEPSVRRLATLADVEAAVPAALSSGSVFFFADIQNNQVDDTGLAVLRFMATRGEGAIVSREILSQRFQNELDKTLNLLLRRELIELVEEGYRFQVELIRRWFA